MFSERELGEMLANSAILLQRTTRRVTKMYDRALGAVGLTANQFGLLASLVAMSARGLDGPSMGLVAERMGMDPTTLNRNSKRLQTYGLISVTNSHPDKRVRTVRITDAGTAKFMEALPIWRQAQAQLDQALGIEARLALHALLTLMDERLTSKGAAP